MACSAADAAAKRAINDKADALIALKRQQPVRVEDLRAIAQEERLAARIAALKAAEELDDAVVKQTLYASQATRSGAQQLKNETQGRVSQLLRDIGDADPPMTAKFGQDRLRLDDQFARVKAAGDALKAEQANLRLADFGPTRLKEFKAAEKTLAAEVDEMVRLSDKLNYNVLAYEKNTALKLLRADQNNPKLLANVRAKEAELRAFTLGDATKALDAKVAEKGAGNLNRASSPEEALQLRSEAAQRRRTAREAEAEALKRQQDNVSTQQEIKARNEAAARRASEDAAAAAAREEDELISRVIRQQGYEDAVRAQNLADAGLAAQRVDARALEGLWGDSRLLLQKVGITGDSTKLQAKTAAKALEARIVKETSPFATPDTMLQQELMRTVEALYKLYR